jgi:hypothetical protein
VPVKRASRWYSSGTEAVPRQKRAPPAPGRFEHVDEQARLAMLLGARAASSDTAT